jgi:signal peptidase I
MLETFLVVLVVLLLVGLFVAQPFQVQKHTMENTLMPDQYVLVDKLTPRFDDFHRGDIVAFNPPAGATQDQSGALYVDRVIGIGGDTVDIHGGHVYLNGSQLTESYVPSAQTTSVSGGAGKTWKLTAGQLFVMADNRGDKTLPDSRDFGAIDKSSVVGRAWLRYWPTGKFGLIPNAAQAPASSGSPAASTAP